MAQTIQTIAAKLASLAPPDAREKRVFENLVGALVALQAASSARYTVEPEPLLSDAQDAAKAVAAGNEPGNTKWLAGWHFNNALHRIAACADRLRTLDDPKGDQDCCKRAYWKRQCDAVNVVQKHVNALKHDKKGRGKANLPPIDLGVATIALAGQVKVLSTLSGVVATTSP